MSFDVIFTFLGVAGLGLLYMIYDAYDRRTKVLMQLVQLSRERLDHSREKKALRTGPYSELPAYNPPKPQKYDVKAVQS